MTRPNFRLDQQTALVTGAASGIGRGIALGLAAAGANVACFDLPETALEEVCDEIIIAGQHVVAVPGDVMDADILADAVRDAERTRPAQLRGQQRRHRQRRAGRGDVTEPVAASDRHQCHWSVLVVPGGGPGVPSTAEARSSTSPPCPGRSSIVDCPKPTTTPPRRPMMHLQSKPGHGMGPARNPGQFHQPRLHRRRR